VPGTEAGDTLAIAAVPHIIPAPTIPNGDVELAISAPLAAGRDEVIYLVCTHERVRWGSPEPDGRLPVLRASGELGGGIRWHPGDVWARVTLPEHAQPSRVPWAVLDEASGEPARLLEAEDTDDPDGADGRNCEELLIWIYDRHLELGDADHPAHGAVEGGRIEFRLEYIGKRRRDALRRPAGAHHRVAQILAKTLLYEPHRLVYMLPCELYFVRHPSSATAAVKAQPLGPATKTTGISRGLLTAVAEEALIAWLGPSYNVQNTGARRFPRSASGEKLTRHGLRTVFIAISPGSQSTSASAARAHLRTRATQHTDSRSRDPAPVSGTRRHECLNRK
jgi:hypothetical protein